MIPNPLHPAVVHFPIVLAVLLPVAAGVALVTIHRGARPLHAWLPVVALSLALTGSAWVAVQTGQNEEERVEAVVAESAIESHEEAAEVFLPMSGVLLLLVGAGLLKDRKGQLFRYAATTGAVMLLAQGIRVGHSGGELVYTHGAASAYTSGGAGMQAPGVSGGEREDEDREHERR